ncbi:MAG: MopE-related protein [Myxococcales bacterium]
MRASLRVGLGLFLALTPALGRAAISQPTGWTEIYKGDTYPSNNGASLNASTSSNRLLLVAIASRATTATAQTVSVSYGGRALTLASGDANASSQQHTYLYYLLDSGIAQAASTSLVVTISGGTSGYTWVYASFFAGIDQAAPFTSIANFNSGSTTGTSIGPFTTPLMFGPNDWPLEVILVQRSVAGSQARDVQTWAASWGTSGGATVPLDLTFDDSNTAMPHLYLAHRVPPSTGGADASQHTANSTDIFSSMTGISLRADAPSTVLGNGSAGTSGTVCPGSADQKLDGFTLRNTSGTNGVTGLTVTTTGSAAIASASIFDEVGTQYFATITSPASDSLSFSGGTNATLPVTTTVASYQVRVTYRDQASAPAGTTSTTARVTGLTTVNPTSGGDSADTTISLDNDAATAATWGATAAGDSSVSLNWAIGTAGDSVLIVRYPAASDTTTPTEGLLYNVGDSFGTGTVAYVGNGTTFTDSPLTNGSTYHYRIFEHDPCRNYSAGTWTSVGLTPLDLVVSLADGVKSGSAPVCPGASARKLDGFAFSSNYGTDSISSLTFTLSGYSAIQTATVWNEPQTIQYFSAVTPSSNTLTFSGGTPIPVSSTSTNYKLLVTYRNEAQSPPAGSTATTAQVTAFATTGANTTDGTDPVDGTLTLNNVAPTPGASWGTNSAGDQQVTLNWTVGTAGNNVLVVRYPNGTDPTLPAEGTPYTVGTLFGTGVVRYVGSLSTFTDTSLANGTAYYYRVFEHDSCNNYVASANAPWTGPLTPRAVTTLSTGTAGTTATICPGIANQRLDGFQLVNSEGSVAVTGLTVTTTGYAAIASASIWNNAESTQYFGAVTNPTSNTLVFSGGTALPVTTTARSFWVRVTYRNHAGAPAGLTSTTAAVGSLVTLNTVTGADTADATITVNNGTPSPGPSWGAISAGDRQTSLSWTYGTAGNTAMVVRYPANTDTTMPTEGTVYAATNPFGTGGTVVYVGTASSTTDTGLTNGTAYYYRVFEYDGCANYAATGPFSGALTPRAITTLSNGVAGTNGTVCPGIANRKLDGFALANTQGAVGVTGLTVNLTGYLAVETVSIWDEAGTTQYFQTITEPTTGTLTFTGGTNPTLPVTAASANYKVQVTYRSEAQIPPAGATATSAAVTSLTTVNTWSGTDAADTTITLNNVTPSLGATWGTLTAGDGQASLAWTPGTAGENVLIVRYTATTDTTLPADGTPYTVGAGFGVGGTVAYAGAGTSFVDSPLGNQTTYFYRVFEYDSCRNFVDNAADAPWSGPVTPKAVTTLANGLAGTSATVCPGAASRKLDGFSLVNSQGSVPVTSLTVTTTGFSAIQSAAIYDEAGGTQYFGTLTTPASNTLVFSGGTAIPVTSTPANYKVVVTYRGETQSPPVNSTPTSAAVTSITTLNTWTGTDTADTTLTLNNNTPAAAAWAATPAGDGQITLNWTLGNGSDSALVVRYLANTDGALPVDGTPYLVDGTFGTGGTIRFVGPGTSFTDSGLANGTTYYYRLFEFDSCLNYVNSVGAAPWTSGLTPRATTTLGNGIAAATATVCPGTASRKLDGFSLVNSQGGVGVTGLTLTVTGPLALQTAAIYDEAGSTQYFTTVTTPATSTLVFSGGLPIPVTNTLAHFKVMVTYRSEAQTPPPGNTATSAQVTSLVTSNNVVGSDAADATITLNNLTPAAGATWGATAAGDGQVSLNWTLGAASDNVVVVRYPSGADATLPADGTSYAAPAPFGSGVVRYAGNGTSFTDTGLTNGTAYYYRVFEHDSCFNYAAVGPWTGPLTPRAVTTLGNGLAGTSGSVCPGTANRKVNGFSLVNSQGGVPVTGLTLTLTGYQAVQSVSVWDEAGAAQYLTAATAPASGTVTLSGGTPIPVPTAPASPANYQIRLTYKTEAQLPPPGSTSTTAFVSAIATTNNTAGSDAADTTVSLNNLTPTPGATWGLNAAGDGQVFLAWTYGTAGNGAVVVRYPANTDPTLPTDGTAYTASNPFGSGGTIRYVGNALTFADTTVANGSSYYYRVFEFDPCLNYVASAASAPWSQVLTPKATTTLGNGVAGVSATVCPGTSGQKLDGFSLVNTQGATPVTALTLTLTGYQAVQSVSIWDESGPTQYFTPINAPASGTLTFSGGTPLPVTTTLASFKVLVTYKSEAQAPPPGATATTAVVSAIATLNNVIGADGADTTVTLNNVTPTPGATWGSVVAGATQNALSWTYGTAGNSALIVRYSAPPDTTLPDDGTSYTAGSAFGTGGTVRYAGAGTSFTDTGLTLGTLYYYRLFELDGCRNYVASAATAPCVTNCGACSDTCANPHGTTQCLSGVCTPACDEGYGDYDGSAKNGCETACDQTAHCGRDCKVCQDGALGHTVVNTCSGNADFAAAACDPTCTPGYLDVDQNGANGCEVACATSARCGTDCAPCQNNHALANLCAGGITAPASQSCKPTCEAGYADLDGDGAAGCETVCDTTAHCGTACRACGADHASHVDCDGPAIASPGSCKPTCLDGYLNFDGDGTNGCEAACENENQCGTDCRPCQREHAVSTRCLSNDRPAITECAPSCEEGYANLDNDGTNGCEKPCDDASHCGLECVSCSRTNTTTVTCTGNDLVATSACKPACTPGHLDVDHDGLTGCEVTCDQPEHCGTTCIQCPDHVNAQLSCGGADKEPATACSFECLAGWTRPDPFSECDTECITVERCGLDCRPCLEALNAVTSCEGNVVAAARSCGFECVPGYADLDGDKSTGCEACAQGYHDVARTPPASCQRCDEDEFCGFASAPYCRDCTTDWDDGLTCVSGRCGCQTKSDCPDQKECRSHTCVTPCTGNSDCTRDGETCCGPAGQKVCVTQGPEICDGRDNDCNGSVDDRLDDTSAPLCDRQQGVCAGARVGCVDGLHQDCNDAVYLAHDPAYEATETLCDGKDNDCNGKTDELPQCAIKPDAGVPPRPDGGPGFNGETFDLGGCGCQHGAGPSAMGVLALLAGGLLARRRGRKDP